MENTLEVKHYDKLFGNCEVLWKIEDFCLAISDENSYFQSSKFSVSGPKSTTWKLIFIPKLRNTPLMRLYLVRLNDDGPVRVSVNWSLTVGSITKDFYYSEFKHDFEKLKKVVTDVSDLARVLSIFEPFGCDTLIVRCHLIVESRRSTVKMNKPETLGFMCLSEDLWSIFVSEKDKDLIIHVGECEILVHKAVLSRNAVLQKLIHNKDKTLEFPHLNSEAVTKYIEYLYTGDLEKILQNPSISMYKCLKEMDIDLLKCYFSLEELKLHTKVKVNELEHIWVIRNFGSRKEQRLESPLFKQTDLDTTWQLTIYLHGIDDGDYLSIYADVVDGNKPKNVCLEFAVEDSEGETYYPRRILSYNGNYSLGIKKFVKNVYLSNTSLVMDDTLKLAFKVRTWDSGEYRSTMGSRMISFTTETGRSSYYELSKSLRNVYRSGFNTDVLIATVGAVFNAHRCILSARSPVLSSMIDEMADKTVLNLNDISPDILNLLLEYTYSGKLLNFDNRTLVELCKAAETYRLLSLKKECQQELRKSAEIQT